MAAFSEEIIQHRGRKHGKELDLEDNLSLNTMAPKDSIFFRSRFNLIKLINVEYKACFEMINFQEMWPIFEQPKQLQSIKKENVQRNTITRMAVRGRGLIFSLIKVNFVSRLMSKSEVAGSKFELIISRSRRSKYLAKGEIDYEGRWSVFGQVFRKLHGMPSARLRRSGQLWDTIFAGERAQDAGGPFREVWSAMIEDLVSPRGYLPLVRPSPNAIDNTGIRSEAFIINPDASISPVQLNMLVFLGKLMGCAMRSKNFLDITLAPFVWQLIAHEDVIFEDVRSIDVTIVKHVERLRLHQVIVYIEYSISLRNGIIIINNCNSILFLKNKENGP